MLSTLKQHKIKKLFKDPEKIPGSLALRRKFLEKITQPYYGRKLIDPDFFAFYDRSFFEDTREASRTVLAPNTVKIHRKEIDVLPLLDGKLAEVGIPKFYGGYWQKRKYFNTAELHENMAYGSSSAAAYFVGNGLFSNAVALYGTQQQKWMWLPQIAKGRKIGCFGLTGNDGGSNPAFARSLRYAKQGDNFILNGSKSFITNGPIANISLVFATGENNKITAFIVPSKIEGRGTGFVAGKPEDYSGWRGSKTSDIFFDDVPVAPENVLGSVDHGLKIAFHALFHMRTNIQAQMLGLIERAYDESLTYVRTRKFRDKPLIEIPGVKDKIMRMASIIDELQEKIYSNAIAGEDSDRVMVLDTKNDRFVSSVMSAGISRLKILACERLNEVAKIATGLQGAQALQEEHSVVSVIRADASVYQIVAGSNDVLQEQVKQNDRWW